MRYRRGSMAYDGSMLSAMAAAGKQRVAAAAASTETLMA